MNDYQFEKAVRMLESIAKSMARIEKQLENLNRTIKPLSSCVQAYPNGLTEFKVSNE